MEIAVGISNRHIHLTKEDYILLFNDEPLTKRNDLNQPGEYASNLEVVISGPKGILEKVRVLGPFRDYTQVEISKTDSYRLGINPPVRTSGFLENAATLEIIGPYGKITRKCAIIATRHIHISEGDVKKYNLDKDKLYKIKTNGDKSLIFENVHLKIRPDAYLELHLDTDDANSSLLKQGDKVKIID